jgi:hypothetical protein
LVGEITFGSLKALSLAPLCSCFVGLVGVLLIQVGKFYSFTLEFWSTYASSCGARHDVFLARLLHHVTATRMVFLFALTILATSFNPFI